jgi:hypothetical protein
MFINVINWRVTASAVIRIFQRLTSHHSLHQPEHIGAFAGSYLAHSDWDQK